MVTGADNDRGAKEPVRRPDSRPGQPAADAMLPVVLEQLRGIAARHLRRERRDHTLQATALVNEAYMVLARQRMLGDADRSMFLGVASFAMRRILVDHAKGRAALKRGGDRQRVTLTGAEPVEAGSETDVLALDEALTKLGLVDEDLARLVELRFFGGLSHVETAEAMGVSRRVLDRKWVAAKAWLRREMGRGRA